MSAKITVNGRTYDSPDAMPPDVRRLYDAAMKRMGSQLADQDGNGIPDVVEGKDGGTSRTTIVNRIFVNGRSYGSVDEMPADVRQLYESNRAKLSEASGKPIGGNATFNLFFNITKHGGHTSAPAPGLASTNAPIGASSTESRIRAILVLFACAVGALIAGVLVFGSK